LKEGGGAGVERGGEAGVGWIIACGVRQEQQHCRHKPPSAAAAAEAAAAAAAAATPSSSAAAAAAAAAAGRSHAEEGACRLLSVLNKRF
jgi:hypothetical protein